MVIILQIYFATCSNELEYLNISFKNSLPSKTFRAYVVFCHKSKPFTFLTLTLIVNKTRLEVFEIEEYHLGNIIGYCPVLAGVYSVT